MAFRHGKNAIFKLGTLGTPGTAIDISAYLDSVQLPRAVDMAEVTVFGNTVKSYLPGLPDSMMSLTGNFDGLAAAIDKQLSDLVGYDGVPAISWEFGPGGSAVLQSKYTGTCYLASYGFTSAVNAKVAFTLTLQQAGSITRAQY